MKVVGIGFLISFRVKLKYYMQTHKFSKLFLPVINMAISLVFCQTIFAQTNSKTIDAELSDWDDEYFANGLTNPWKLNTVDKTLFDFKVANDQFYFYFKTVDNTLTTVPFIEEMSVAAGDRVELFFSSDKSAQNYYCAEMDPNGEVLDYNAKFYRKFDNDWDFKTLLLSSKITNDGYIVEGKISVK